MAGITKRLSRSLRSRGIAAVYEPVVMLADAARLDLDVLVEGLPPLSSASLSHGVRATLRSYLPIVRPTAASLIFDGDALGVELPFQHGSWCVVEAETIAIHVPHGLPETIGIAVMGRRLGDVVSIAGIDRLDYLIDGSQVAIGRTAGSPGFDVLRAPVPVILL